MSQREQQLIEQYWIEYSRRIFVYIGTLVGYDKELREDLIQTIYLKAYKRIDTKLPGTSPAKWLIAIARNTAIDYLRSREREHVKNDSFAVISEKKHASAEQAAESEFEKHFLREAIKKLPAHLSEVIYLRFYEEMSFKTISEITGASTAALKSRVYKAKQKLKEILEVEYGFVATR
jgi:RNA polymerase sigma-70 factor (ECF subfamily)